MTNDDELDLPRRELIISKPVNSVSTNSRIADKQRDVIVKAGARAAADVGHMAKDIVAIVKIREQAGADVARINAETERVVRATRAEIDRLVQVGKNLESAGDVAVRIIDSVARLIQTMPESDGVSRGKAIDALRDVVAAALRHQSARKA